MEILQKKYTVESLTELIRQDPDKGFEEMQKMPDDECRAFLVELPRAEYSEVFGRALLANFTANLEAKVETP